MKTYALVGKQLDHSFSQRYFTQFFETTGRSDCRYLLSPTDTLVDLQKRVVAEQWQGFNVTIPYKQAILPMLHSMSDEAHAIGAVNCVVVDSQNRWIGYNTDAPAFRDTLSPLLKPYHRRALVFGTGGASRAVTYVLKQLDIDFLLVSRNPHDDKQIAYTEVPSLLNDALLLVNCTPLGTAHSPFEGLSPLPSTLPLSSRHFCYDLVYNPSPTPFLLQATHHGATIQGGLPMLYRQAELSWEIWSGES